MIFYFYLKNKLTTAKIIHAKETYTDKRSPIIANFPKVPKNPFFLLSKILGNFGFKYVQVQIHNIMTVIIDSKLNKADIISSTL